MTSANVPSLPKSCWAPATTIDARNATICRQILSSTWRAKLLRSGLASIVPDQQLPAGGVAALAGAGAAIFEADRGDVEIGEEPPHLGVIVQAHQEPAFKALQRRRQGV